MGIKLSGKSRSRKGSTSVNNKKKVVKYSSLTLTLLSKEEVEASRSSAYEYVL